MDLFKNRKLIIATKHEKETVIAPLLEKELGVLCFIDENFDTDILGTFTGEVERKFDPITTARKKCLMAMEANDCDLGVASEWSFWPHPSLFFVGSDEEFLIFIDKKNNLEIIAREISLDTNFHSKELHNETELWEFMKSVKFPSHGIILRKSKSDKKNIHKGIIDEREWKNIFQEMLKKYGTVFAETDMRALYNPTRMAVIKKATKKLITQIQSSCPQCDMPGFSVTNVVKWLPCSLCGLPTDSALSYIYVCEHCQFRQEIMYPHKKHTEDPGHCLYCNP